MDWGKLATDLGTGALGAVGGAFLGPAGAKLGTGIGGILSNLIHTGKPQDANASAEPLKELEKTGYNALQGAGQGLLGGLFPVGGGGGTPPTVPGQQGGQQMDPTAIINFLASNGFNFPPKK